jgi:hypothetical protein
LAIQQGSVSEALTTHNQSNSSVNDRLRREAEAVLVGLSWNWWQHFPVKNGDDDDADLIVWCVEGSNCVTNASESDLGYFKAQWGIRMCCSVM